MRLRIDHITTYRYTRPVRFLSHKLMLRPRGHQDMRVVQTDLICRPSATVDWSQDVFGNLIATANFQVAAASLVIETHIIVDLSAEPWPILSISPAAHNFPFSYSDADVLDLGALRESQYSDASGAVRAWTARFREQERTDTLTMLKRINFGIASEFAYRVRYEDGAQPPDETINSASGCCRDLATLFIEAVRQLGFGARAVSGYLLSIDPMSGVVDHESHETHAWAEVYLPGAGWIAFDPTHGRIGGAGLVPVAVARHIDQISPITGSYAGADQDFVDMRVEIRTAIVPDSRAG